MHENDQATIKTRYCGHLYVHFLHKWTLLDQRDQVSYYEERGLSGAWRVTFCFGERPCRVLSPLLSNGYMGEGVERGLERTQFARLLSRPLLWLTGLSHVELMSPAMREAWLERGPALVILGPFCPICLWSLKPSLCDVLERCRRRWIACRWSDLMQL
jgi:hypothetical protein